MGVLTSQQTTQAVRGLIYFGAHEYEGEIELADCTASIKTSLETVSAPTADKESPIDEQIEASFGSVVHDGRQIEGSITVVAKIRWASLYDRMKLGNPNFSIIEQPQITHNSLTRNCLIAFSRLITKHQEEIKEYKKKRADMDEAKSKAKDKDKDKAKKDD